MALSNSSAACSLSKCRHCHSECCPQSRFPFNMIIRHIRRRLATLFLLAVLLAHQPAAIAAPVRVVVSFSILEDIVRRIGGGAAAVPSPLRPHPHDPLSHPHPHQPRLRPP